MSRDHSSALFCQGWTVQKAGLKPEQNEDACVTREFERENTSPGLLVAIADGATEAVYSRLWAKKLVEAAGPDWPSLTDDALGELIKQVCKEFSPIEPGLDIPWFVRNKYMDQGSQATLLVATVVRASDADSFDVQAVSVGDCCLILFKASGEVFSFPMHSSDEFGVNPVLLGNRIPRPASYDRWEGRVEPGDMILFGTDAISKWVLECPEENQSGLLFDGLLVVLDQRSSALSQPVEVSAPEGSQPDTMAATGEPGSENLKESEKSATLGVWLGRLWPWSSPQRQETSVSAYDQEAVPNGAANLIDRDVISQVAQPAIADAASDSRLRFEQFVERYRAPQSELHMRNDDSTLIVCIPVRGKGEDQEHRALQVVRGIKTAVAERLQASQ